MNLKRVVLMGMICLMALACACDTATSKESMENVKVEETEKNIQKETEQVVENEEDILLPNVYEVPGTTICVNVPELHAIEEGFTQVYYEDLVKYVTFTCVRTETATDEKDAFEIAYQRFIRNMSGLDIINQLGEVTEDNITINGLNVYSFEGLMNCGSNPVYDAYIKGYSFIYEDMPCAIIGVVMDETQPQEQIDAVKELVDAMILTVRSEK